MIIQIDSFFGMGISNGINTFARCIVTRLQSNLLCGIKETVINEIHTKITLKDQQIPRKYVAAQY